MAIVKWMKGIEYVSGLLSKRPKAGDNHSSHSSALLATHRVAPTTNPVCTRLYAVGEYSRSTEPSAEELAKRERFAAISQAVATRMQDLTKVAQDTAAFKAQKDQAGGKQTMRSYLWSLEKATYDASH